MKVSQTLSDYSAEANLSRSVRRRRGAAIGKRTFDLVLALLLLPILLPVIAALCVITRLDGGAGIYGHKRVGQDGHTFRCWKIRSMVENSGEVLERHLAENPEAAAEWARGYKLSDDPRVTRLGNFLRKTSLDELPQIWNVLRGEMSFVGPRPVTEVELKKYQGYEWCYLSVKPGITGFWQVAGRGNVDYKTRVRMDVTYFHKRSFLGDILIIARTAGVVVRGTGQ
ncbi:Sugar transferase involved in LPS biosynthesis (colanic, teichoic acid) [Jannaschia faecimaris]|uniref:Sugar transferase involved in LPS biosynthesis (Colanic, teichoic acid) n=1 Tax=Jannaschia faecimaris TaxID=1244108 RepID=A0A1H3LVI2_9RHOB|nr:sugar transferase [Jannaschia faecimaris]SDY68547.1 Sugar transferase involved in LPS biosynthesis (colanic, teichoic acid) [Jannaschia faecimaris]